MPRRTLYTNYNWRPPSLDNSKTTLILLCSIILSRLNPTFQQEPGDAEIKINVETTPFTLRFSLEDPEKYEIVNVTCTGSGSGTSAGSEVIANEDHVCEGLLPCWAYKALVVLKASEDEELLNQTLDANTDYEEPTIQITSVQAFEHEIQINWNAEHRTCISVFEVHAKSSRNNFERQEQRDKSESTIEELSACEEYVVSLRVLNITNDLVGNQTRTVITLFDEPSDIENLVLTKGTDIDQVHIKWDPPKQVSCVEVYYLKWFILDCKVGSEDAPLKANQVDECTWFYNLTNPDIKEYTISGLQGCENYGLEIYINNDTNLRSDRQTFSSDEQLPSPVVLEAPTINSVNVTLRWKEPAQNCKCVHHYMVFVTGPLQKGNPETKNTATDDLWTIFEGLSPCGEYEYEVFPVSLNTTHVDKTESKFDTSEAKPSAVRNHQVVAEAYTLSVAWEPPTFADLCVVKYRISVWKDEYEAAPAFGAETPDTSINITDLYSCQAYIVQIIPVNKFSDDGELIQIKTETTADKPLVPLSVDPTQLYSTSAYVNARSSDSKNTCEIIFARYQCSLLDANSNAEIREAETYVESKIRGTTFSALIEPLSPKTQYVCTVAFYNVAGWSPSKPAVLLTWSSFPTTPRNIAINNISEKFITFTWQEPKHINGNLQAYKLHFQFVKANYIVPRRCAQALNTIIERETTSRQETYYDRMPYTKYSIQISAQNEHGIGEYSLPYMAITKPAVSEPVFNLSVETEGPYENANLTYQAKVMVRWGLPCASNSEIKFFVLRFKGVREEVEEQEIFTHEIEPDIDEDGNASYNETNLKPEYTYDVSVAIRSEGVEEISRFQTTSFEAPAGIPKGFNETTKAQARVNAFEADNPTTSALVRFPAYILNSESGKIVYAALLLSQKDCSDEPELLFGALNSSTDWPDVLTYKQAYNNTNCIRQYQTTMMRWVPIENPQTNEVEFIIGTEKCNDGEDTFCNGPLKPDTEFYLVIRLFTKSGYNDAVRLEFHTDSILQLTIILISVSCCLGLAFIVGFVYLYITKKRQMDRRSGQGIEDSFGDIMPKNYAIHYKEISKPEKLAREFKELSTLGVDLSYSASELGYEKNRYSDIFPYDKNRVILDIDTDGSDYINASFIDGYRRKKEYIATQGPKPESTMDFWRMILQHNVRVIVMVTQFREGDTIKCHEYFPYRHKGVNVCVKRKELFDIYDRTELCVTHENYGMKQKVVHFYFKKWPDHGVPTDPQHLIAFIRKVKSERIPSYSSTVVHCSAGVGRTGTYIGLDIVMQRLKNENKINIYETVKKLRFQRMKMVQTLAQYTFLYTCAFELVRHKYLKATNNDYNENVPKIDKQHNDTPHHKRVDDVAAHSTRTIGSSKKVSFEDDPEMNIGMSGVPHKYNSSRHFKSSLNGSTQSGLDAADRPRRSDIVIMRQKSPVCSKRMSSTANEGVYDARKETNSVVGINEENEISSATSAF